MARRRNDKARNAIARNAYRLFLKHGYQGTRYDDIAVASSVQKTNVQYYFPKKETLLVDMYREILDESNKAVDTLDLGNSDPYLNNFIVSQVYFAFVLKDAPMRRLTLDALSSRSVTDQLLKADEEWSLSTLHLKDGKEDLVAEMHLFVGGGVYDYLYRQLSNDIVPDPFHVAYRPMSTFWTSVFEFPEGNRDKTLQALRVSDEYLDRASELISQHFEDCILQGLSSETTESLVGRRDPAHKSFLRGMSLLSTAKAVSRTRYRGGR